jgi:TrmH family RNA methyltransferase
MNTWRDNIFFTLVEPKEQGNIGASARAIKNMGFRNLCLVNPPKIDNEAYWFACNANNILESAKIYNTLDDAIGDKALVIGTTRRIGKRRGLIIPITEVTEKIREIAFNNKVVILFGREDKGLFNEEIEKCGFSITIPTSYEQPSLNLSQAVLIVAYELSNVELTNSENKGKELKLVNTDELTILYSRISNSLKLLGYIPKGDKNLEKKIMTNLKHFIGRAGLTDWELKMLHGICSQIEKAYTKNL